MKKFSELLAAKNQLTRLAEAEVKALLLASGAAYFCTIEGSVDDDAASTLHAGGEPVTLSLDLEVWREHGRTRTAAGRAALAAEDAAAERVLALARSLGTVTRDGDGSGQLGPVTCYVIA